MFYFRWTIENPCFYRLVPLHTNWYSERFCTSNAIFYNSALVLGWLPISACHWNNVFVIRYSCKDSSSFLWSSWTSCNRLQYQCCNSLLVNMNIIRLTSQPSRLIQGMVKIVMIRIGFFYSFLHIYSLIFKEYDFNFI